MADDAPAGHVATETEADGTLVVRASGELDMASRASIEAAVFGAIEPAYSLILDLAS